jgi:hypothetical protein
LPAQLARIHSALWPPEQLARNLNWSRDVALSQAEIDAAPPRIAAAYAIWRQGPPVERYDLHADPAERVNLAGRTELAGVQVRLFEALQH